jgi:hypothetical protein
MAKKFDNEVYSLMESILTTREVYECFEKLEAFNDQRVTGNFLSF